MTVAPKPAPRTPTSETGGGQSHSNQGSKQAFVALALDMSWRLAVVVLVPVVGGVQLDKRLGSSHVWLFVGLGVALIGSTAVMWRAMQVANRLPVPKLTEEQRQAIRKQYEEEDKD